MAPSTLGESVALSINDCLSTRCQLRRDLCMYSMHQTLWPKLPTNNLCPCVSAAGAKAFPSWVALQLRHALQHALVHPFQMPQA